MATCHGFIGASDYVSIPSTFSAGCSGTVTTDYGGYGSPTVLDTQVMASSLREVLNRCEVYSEPRLLKKRSKRKPLQF